MNFECWSINSWTVGSWVDGSWCPGIVPPTPVVATDERRWPGPPITLYRETDIIPNWQRKREDEEIILL